MSQIAPTPLDVARVRCANITHPLTKARAMLSEAAHWEEHSLIMRFSGLDDAAERGSEMAAVFRAEAYDIIGAEQIAVTA